MLQCLSASWGLVQKPYDFVIRARTDFALNRSFDFGTMERGKIYQPNSEKRAGAISGNDQFAIGSPKVMQVYMSAITSARAFVASGDHVAGEHLIDFHLKHSGFSADDVVALDMNDPFPPSGIDVMPNSLLRGDYATWRGISHARQRRTLRERLRRAVAKLW